MSNKVTDFFSRMKNDEHRVFEITMFSVSSVVAVVVIACGVMLGSFYFNKGNQITDKDANEGSVTGPAIAERDDVEETATPDSNAVIHDDDFVNDIDENLANSEFAYTTTNVNMRSEDSLTAAVLTKLESSTKVKVIGLTKDKEWCEVEYNGQRGYIKSLYLSTTKPTPIATVAPTSRPTKEPDKTKAPTVTKKPAKKPTKKPTATPDDISETAVPTDEPVITPAPTAEPTKEPTAEPTKEPTKEPAATDTAAPAGDNSSN